MTAKRFHARVKGHVQGVGFRQFVYTRARSLGLRGYVRNRLDGSVEVVAEGDESALGQLAKALHEGPSGAWVESVEIEWGPAQGGESAFTIKF